MYHEAQVLISQYHTQSPIRDPRLFSHFLIPGYKMTTVSSVNTELMNEVLLAKLNLGMFITLIDDLADHPKYFNPRLLQHMYELLPGKVITTTPHLTKRERMTFDLGKELMRNLYHHLSFLPNYRSLRDIFEFDLVSVYRANRYSELMHTYPEITNLKESRSYGHYNMGMLAAGMIDLMGSSHMIKSELGLARECFLLGQRMGRIGNLIATYDREMTEHDVTNEISVAGTQGYQQKLKAEFDRLSLEIENIPMMTFNPTHYAQGMKDLYELHMKLLGVI